jgi:uncharacterized protein
LPRKFFRKYLPDSAAIRRRPVVAAFGGWLAHPGLWCFSRRSVAGAVAIGLFCGLIPGPLQMLGALLLAIPLRKNIPVALIVTLYTNPLTIVPLYLLAYAYGALLLGETARPEPLPRYDLDWYDLIGSIHAMGEWAMSLGKPLGLGLVALGLTLAALGYCAVRIGWRIYLVSAWRARKRRRRAS